MKPSRTTWVPLAGAGAFAVALPALLLSSGNIATPRKAVPEVRTVIPPPIPAVAAIYERSLFAPAEGGDTAPADAPALVGIAGRLNRDAVALVRLGDGSSRSLKLGESVDGWRLESLAIDAAFFTRGRERVRVAMAADGAADQ
ncbi:hypothetical protein [Sphingomonas turrisvirgatae]|uniref:Type II secretion system protein GspC N-terminal domain-containing protein n=1 Tax=Sphingomonas turrisvirgatae TaxID=1888892 RepID=A0A1E3M078_9SPHN|nr:hypothetical protein [Sphingomonas turrisvirgatae]ODP39421.1 hypothetical protein BFL28_10105 [Sphingomonas turrisvirgatae]